MFLDPAFNNPLHKLALSQQVQLTRCFQILTMTSSSKTPVPLSDVGLRNSVDDLATQNELLVTDLSCIDSTSIQELYQVLLQLVGLAYHLLANFWLTATTTRAKDCDYLRQQHDQEKMAQQIAPTYITQYDAEIQQLQTRNKETTAEYNAYQDKITTLQNKLNHKRTNVEAL
jgi:hypothetical protein